MTPKEFVALVDNWSATGGEFRDPDRHVITTPAEVDAICRGLDSDHIFAANSIHTPAFFYLAAYFHYAETDAAVDAVRTRGLDRLRRIFNDLLDQPTNFGERDYVLVHRYQEFVFILQVLAEQKVRGDGSLIVRGARDRRLDGGTWSMVFEFLERGHPDTGRIFEALRDPLPEGSCGLCYLYWTNKFASNDAISPHSFASDAGIARLARYLSDPDPENHFDASCAVAALPFVDADARTKLLDIADRHPDGRVRLEAAAASARTGSELGAQRLAELCRDPRFVDSAIERLEKPLVPNGSVDGDQNTASCWPLLEAKTNRLADLRSLAAPPDRREARVSPPRKPARLPQRLADRHGAGHGHVERAQAGLHGDAQAHLRSLMDMRGHPRRFAAEQQDVARLDSGGRDRRWSRRW